VALQFSFFQLRSRAANRAAIGGAGPKRLEGERGSDWAS